MWLGATSQEIGAQDGTPTEPAYGTVLSDMTPTSNPEHRGFRFRLRRDSFRELIDLRHDQASAETVDAAIRAGVEFRGTNLWLLVFATFIASIGLNVNSAAVIIGAMLISPLMGPIMGIGYSAAVNDFALMRAAARSLGLAVVFSLITSALYFTLSPLADARSEILARTSPTIWDVLIAVFGGFAGIIGITRREKSNVIPGVAIATALMPPLCTAGFGIATLNPAYLFGALYLFTINSVFIATATLVMVRVMRVPEVAVLDDATRARARRAIAFVVLVTGVPSIYLALRLVQQEVFVARAEAFVASAFPRELGTYVVSRDVSASTRAIRVTVVGEPVTDDRRIALEQSLRVYGLDTTELQVDQTRSADVDVASIKAEVAGDLYQDTFVALEAKTRQIETLQQQIDGLEATRQSLSEIAAELRASRPDASGVAVGLGSVSNGEQPTRDVLIVSLDLNAPLSDEERVRLEAWLEVRSHRNVVLSVNVAPPATPRAKRKATP